MNRREQAMQKALMEWAALIRMPDSPDPERKRLLDWLFHVPNERESAIQRAILSSMGVKKGMPDLICFMPRGLWCGAMLELKDKGKKPTPEQLDVLEQAARAGWAAQWCDNIEDAMKFFIFYLKEPYKEKSWNYWPKLNSIASRREALKVIS